MKSEKEILDDLINRYLRLGFGKILKSEIDLLMFDTIIQKYINEKKKKSLLALDQFDINSLSQKLKISESKVNTYIEALCLYTEVYDKNEVLNNLLYLLKTQKQKPERLEKGEFSLQIVNKALRNAIKNHILNLNQQVDNSFNSEILVFDITILLSLFNEKQEDFIKFLKNKKLETKEIEKLNELTRNGKYNKGIELFKKGIGQILAKYIGIEADFINEVFDYFQDKINNK